ncbi:MAG: NAD(P)H-hydrate dehydratase [Proteobacteria bacterium]|nr:NAD(P)H-hydrate dehydratase [Desulfobulbaceae bacterium]MBU4152803.1 NAD(P)H-hydrate dehydratase [Pseudomonadota bacterium]MDP2106010.1 NAD(P)H-hydrate dehydratase [Desulfobulbaceae bacterium]
MKLAKAADMRAIDHRAIQEYGIPGVVLMENAGRSVVEFICRWQGPVSGKRAVVVVGPGNNGGDGLVVARYLYQAGCRVMIVSLVDPEVWQGDAAINWRIVQKLSVPVVKVLSSESVSVCETEFACADFLVDAIFGTGLARTVSGHFARAIDLINQANRSVISVDIPSGLNSDTGCPLGSCVRAGLTVTFGLAKPGQVIHPGIGYVGRLEVADIGIPDAIIDEFGLVTEFLVPGYAIGLLSVRQPTSHKGTFGHLLLLAGSQGKTGAAMLAVLGALRSGVGLASLAIPRLLNPVFEVSLMEAMTIPLASDYFLGVLDSAAIALALKDKDALVLGPGLGSAPETVDLICRLYREVSLPMVVDADALTALGMALPVRSGAPERVLTPHPGEMARLTGLSVMEIQGDRIQVAADYAQSKGAVVVLKGAATVIAGPDGRVAINSSGNPGMAAGGMGDVLAGVIGSLLSQGLTAWDAACLGVLVHGMAADRLVRTRSYGGFLASEVAAELPAVFQEIFEGG